MKLVSSKPVGQRRVYDIEVADVHNFYANGVNVHNCATDGGVSVIKDDGTVVDIVSSLSSSNNVGAVAFMENGGIALFHQDSFNLTYTGWKVYEQIPTVDTTYTQASSKDYAQGGIPSMSPRLSTIGPTANYDVCYGGNKFVLAPESGFGNYGIAIAEHYPSDTNKAMVSYITSSYNSGHMVGDIKLAALSDTTAETIGTAVTELVTDGTFDAADPTVAWSKTATATLTSSGGQATFTPVALYQSFSQVITTQANQVYKLLVDIDSGGTMKIIVFDGAGSSGTRIVEAYRNPGVHEFYFKPTLSTATIYLEASTASTPTVYNTVSVTPTTELVENGTFDAGTTGWSAGNAATLSVSSGQLVVTYNGTNNPYAYQAVTTVVGKTYTVSLDAIYAASTLALNIGTTAGGSTIHAGAFITSSSSYTVTFTATGTTTYLNLVCIASAAGSGSFDNISVRPAVEDRSVNNNGLQVHGQLTKTAVATGADLVAWSGFSANNYLEQPYNSDLDFGTGDFCVMGWVKTNDTAGRLLCRSTSGSNNYRIVVDVSSSLYRVFTEDTGGAALISSSTTVNNTWQFITAVRSSGVMYLYINAHQENSAANTDNVSAVSGTQVLKIGDDPSTGNAISGSLALWRIGAGAPTAEQIAQIYEDEKVLFQDGAQATLYGTSDAVTALAYDSDTELLSVGTSAGRSDFKGLRRVNNTTTAVTTAISASNSMIVEQ